MPQGNEAQSTPMLPILPPQLSLIDEDNVDGMMLGNL